MAFYIPLILGALAATVFGASGPRHLLGLASAAVACGAMVGGLALTRGVPLGVGPLSFAIVATALIQLLRPGWSLIAPFAAGVLAMQIAALAAAQGVPMSVSATCGLTIVLVSLWLHSRRNEFAPPLLRDEAALVMLVLAVLGAAAPEVAAGWKSATALNSNGAPQAAGALMMPGWVVALVAMMLAAGGMSRFRRRR